MTKKLNVFNLRSETRQLYLLLPLLFNVVLEVLARTIMQEKAPGLKEDVKLPLSADDMTLYIENTK